MPARIQLDLLTDEAIERIAADSFLSALDASLEILRQIDRASVSGGKFEWYYTFLAVGSGLSVVEGQISQEDIPDAEERKEAERRLESLYINGLGALEASAQMPQGFTGQTAEAAIRLASVLSDGVTRIVVGAVQAGPSVTISERLLANAKELTGRGFTDVGSIEGKLETISLAGRPTFNVRDEVTGQSVVCAFTMDRLEEIKRCLGRRVLVSGDVTYHKRGHPTEVSPVDVIRLLDENEPQSVLSIRGIERGITEGMPAGLYVRQRFYGE